MKFLLSLILLVTFSTAASAQTALDEQIALTRQSMQTDRKIILMGNMTFTSDESAQFWPAWNEYRAAMAANGDRETPTNRLRVLVCDDEPGMRVGIQRVLQDHVVHLLPADHIGGTFTSTQRIVRGDLTQDHIGFYPAFFCKIGSRKLCRLVVRESVIHVTIRLNI
mgnify:CR=1 FL=1